MSSAVHDAYVADLADVARRWLDQHAIDGTNPFQPPEAIAEHRRATVDLIREFSSPGERILDAGCAMGDTLADLDELDRHGIDIVPDYLDLARENGLHAVEGDLAAMPYPDEHFDVVVATDVLEHVLDLNAVVRELLRVLRADGRLIMRVPDEEDLEPYLQNAPWTYVHLRRFDSASVVMLFSRIFACEIVRLSLSHGDGTRELHAVVRKP